MTIQGRFELLRKKGEKALICYITAGYPTLEDSMDIVKQLSQSGADLIEIGLPFSDPIADGPTIQRASYIGLQNGVTLKKTIERVQSLELDVPLILMSYLNPLLAYGDRHLYSDMKNAGFSGLIVPDLPVDEAGEWILKATAHAMDLVFLVAPTSGANRIRRIVTCSSGFIYCVTTTGTTGVRKNIPSELSLFVKKIKKMTDKPVAVGFGVSTIKQIKTLCDVADGVIVGSRIIEAIHHKENVKALVGSFKEATKRQ